jgi:hypothetical protein
VDHSSSVVLCVFLEALGGGPIGLIAATLSYPSVKKAIVWLFALLIPWCAFWTWMILHV